MACSRGIWLEFRGMCNRNTSLDKVCDCHSSALSGNKMLRQWDFLYALFSHTAKRLPCILNSVKHIRQVYLTLMWLHWNVLLFLSCRIQEGAVLYSIHDRHFGIMDEYFMACWTWIHPGMLLAVDTIHAITLSYQWLDTSPSLEMSMQSDLRIRSCFWKGKLRNRKQGEAEWLSYQ